MPRVSSAGVCVPILAAAVISFTAPRPASAQTAEDPWASLSGQGNVESLMGAMEFIQCSGGARSWNVDQDIQVTLSLYVDNQLFNQNSAWGYQPSTQANSNVERLEYARSLRCELYAPGAYAYATGTLIPDCGDDRTDAIREYPQEGVSWTPTCGDFTTSVPTLSHYSFGQWNSGDYTHAILRDVVVGNTYCVVANYGLTPTFNSGYRNPVHNMTVSNSVNSRHVYGDAVDLDTPNAPNNTMYDDLKWIAKNGSCGVACVEPRDISPSHYHGDYRGSCPGNW